MRTKIFQLILAVAAITLSAPINQRTTFAGGQKGGSDLAGTSWKLVKVQTDSEQTLVPDDKTKYTITFGKDGRVTARVDCNRASSTWRSNRPNELQFGSWTRSQTKCGANSLHDKIVHEGANPKSYSIKDGRLYLTGMAAGGFYELEPLAKSWR